jgi:hypothetical protein
MVHMLLYADLHFYPNTLLKEHNSRIHQAGTGGRWMQGYILYQKMMSALLPQSHLLVYDTPSNTTSNL